MATLSCVLRLFLILAPVLSLPERGVWNVTYDQNNQIHSFSKSAFKDTNITLSIKCTNPEQVILEVSWLVRWSPCAQEYDDVESDKQRKQAYLYRPEIQYGADYNYKTIEYLTNTTTVMCSFGSEIDLPNYSLQKPMIVDAEIYNLPSNSTKKPTDDKKSTTGAPKTTKAPAKTQANQRRKRDADAAKTTALVKPKETTTAKQETVSYSHDTIDHSVLTSLWKDGYFVFILQLKPSSAADFSAEVAVKMKGPHGYISAVEYPLEIFYGVMGLLYLVYGIVWLVLLGCNWRELLRVQFWIEGVIVLGMLEKAVFFAEYENIAKNGESVQGAIIVAELVSSMKRALARMLVIVVSLGFGIVKPRLGQTFHKVLCVGVMYFVLGSIEGCMRSLRPKSDQSNETLLAAIPLAVLDAVICWWIFASLVQTTRTLRLRRNIVKLSLYRHFTNTLIFAVLASIAYMIWSITQHKMKACITDWRELWVDEAFWHLLFSVLLLIIMILWRPTANNQRYAFSPLLDAAEDEIDDDTVMNDAFDGMKMRQKITNGSPKQKDRQKSVEDDLKWIEENIPTSVVDKALPSLLQDSDEELQTNQYEISKME